MNTELSIVPVDSQELLTKCAEWMKSTGAELVIAQGSKYYAVMRGEEFVAVARYRNEPALSVHFSPDGSGIQTHRAFSMLRAAMQFIGARPLVMVDKKSPLAQVAPKIMRNMSENRDFYRME